VEPGISSLLGAAERGDASAADVLFAALYSELHRLASSETARASYADHWREISVSTDVKASGSLPDLRF